MKEKILDDHKKVGKVFRPPLMTLGVFTETSWEDFAMPEFIWIFLLIDKFGIPEGDSLVLDISRAADKYLMTKEPTNPAKAMLLSSYNFLSVNEKENILSELKRKGKIQKIQSALSNFLTLYPECPLAFLNKQDDQDLRKNYLPEYKNKLTIFYDKLGVTSTLVIASVTHFLVTMNRIVISSDIEMPHLDEILKYPETDASKRLAAFLRNATRMCFAEGHYSRANEWIKYFWNRSVELEPCKI